MKIVQPVDFKNAFLHVVVPMESRIFRKWHFPWRNYTSLMYKVFPEVAKELHLSIYNGPYYTLDAVFYESNDEVHFAKGATYVHSISVALEHENDIGGKQLPNGELQLVFGSATEINKLQLFNTPLKVLITYASQEWHNLYLQEYAKMIKEADIFDDFSTARETTCHIRTHAELESLLVLLSIQTGRL